LKSDAQPFCGSDLNLRGRSVAALDLQNLRLVEVDAETCELGCHGLLREFRQRCEGNALGGGADNVAPILLILRGAQEGALLLFLFGAGIMLSETEPTRTTLVKPSPERPLTILCVDDHTLVGEAVARVFTTAGYRVERVHDGRLAWHKISPNPAKFDVVVTDHQMPHMNGLELVRLMREAHFPGRIIVYGGALSPADEARYREFSVDAIVTKGPDSAKILAIVEAFHGEVE
jgi:CheY-like chemotaxis protein